MKIDDIRGFRADSKNLIGVKNKRRFRSDDGAFEYVEKSANEGCRTAKRAIKLCPKQKDYLNDII